MIVRDILGAVAPNVAVEGGYLAIRWIKHLWGLSEFGRLIEPVSPEARHVARQIIEMITREQYGSRLDLDTAEASRYISEIAAIIAARLHETLDPDRDRGQRLLQELRDEKP